ncbi:Demethylspheroidene O-methyltransferase [Pseudovibrio axinellae]|uniref:Demethylspheroidene O-methyltransferase n=1 Tax=Pseudovibrio axinellae TaxID=989403 RepID=A0A165VUD7_9HYPH|nr:methyltransferase [Pseudovibrio axinellae]KZL15458.1 Demethylspheroidene O-methyltransferase [Pseudovibrio axinellae]SER94972.1 Dimerisation domain-containing protein [Pseudovibrio axinellae]
MTYKPLETSEELSQIAFGFMASKALFAGLHIDLFSLLSGGGKTARDISSEAGIAENRVTTLVTALACVGVLVRNGERYTNSQAAEKFLVKGSRYDFGDYLRCQIDQQMYPLLLQLNDSLEGKLQPDHLTSYAKWMSDKESTELYSISQHAGSIAPAQSLARKLDLSKARNLLDVGGGTGAMTISLCDAYEALSSTIIDFPNVAELGQGFIEGTGLGDRVRYISGNALECEWPDRQDVVLMSYLLSGVPGERISTLLDKSKRALLPDGRLVLHDFIVEADRSGPPLSALWQLQHMSFTPEAQSLSVSWLCDALTAAGYKVQKCDELIPGMTKYIVAEPG